MKAQKQAKLIKELIGALSDLLQPCEYLAHYLQGEQAIIMCAKAIMNAKVLIRKAKAESK